MKKGNGGLWIVLVLVAIVIALGLVMFGVFKKKSTDSATDQTDFTSVQPGTTVNLANDLVQKSGSGIDQNFLQYVINQNASKNGWSIKV